MWQRIKHICGGVMLGSGILLFVMALCLAWQEAKAADIEVGVGATHFKKANNGRYWVEGYPYIEELNDTSISIGISQKWGRYRYRAEFVHLGEMRLTAIAPDDNNYSPMSTTSHPEAALYRLNGRGTLAGGIVSVSNDVRLGPAALYIEAGAFIYKPTWQVEVYREADNAYLGHFQNNSKISIGPVMGIGVRCHPVQVGLRLIRAKGQDIVIPVPWGDIWSLQLSGAF